LFLIPIGSFRVIIEDLNLVCVIPVKHIASKLGHPGLTFCLAFQIVKNNALGKDLVCDAQLGGPLGEKTGKKEIFKPGAPIAERPLMLLEGLVAQVRALSNGYQRCTSSR
jgi:hypothetical protein